eukprot:GHVP01005939.1.p1 GENE.GHVP01005939.1~~GHVP01005939.1.p1  ORF type:complete len:437 (+),score=77.18 GHVP01005939.1:1235-2545(+)
MKLKIGLSLFFGVSSQLVSEIYQTCNAEEGYIARCGPGANCFIIDNIPTCHCVIDPATGLPLAGNPYRGCTWDISGIWQLYSYQSKLGGFFKEILGPLNNDPIVIQVERTDAILKTAYMTGAVFVVTALSASISGVCARAYLDVNDNTSIIFEFAEGFLDQYGRTLFARTNNLDTTLVKRHPFKTKKKDGKTIKGKWQKLDGSIVKIYDMKKPKGWPGKKNSAILYKKKMGYWYNDSGFGAPLLRLSTCAWLDTTLPEEQIAFETESRFQAAEPYSALAQAFQPVAVDIGMIPQSSTTPPPIITSSDNVATPEISPPTEIPSPPGDRVQEVFKPRRSFGSQLSTSRRGRLLVTDDDFVNVTLHRSPEDDAEPPKSIKRRLQDFLGSLYPSKQENQYDVASEEVSPWHLLWELAQQRLDEATAQADAEMENWAFSLF